MCALDMVQYTNGQSFQNISNLTLHQFGRMAHIEIFEEGA